VTKTKVPYYNVKVSKIEISKNFGPLIEHVPHWINFIIITFTTPKHALLPKWGAIY
jgi:hypothetical protein